MDPQQQKTNEGIAAAAVPAMTTTTTTTSPILVEDDELVQDTGTDDGDTECAMEMGHWNRDWQQQQPQDQDQQQSDEQEEESEESFVTSSKAPPRKLTSTSDATTMTAQSSFLDDELSYYESKASFSNNSTIGKKPRLDSMDEMPEASFKDGSGRLRLGVDDLDNQSLGSHASSKTDEDSQCWIWFKRVLLFLVIFGFMAFFAVLIGAAIEKRSFADAGDTSHLYHLPQVCGVADPKVDAEGITFDSAQMAHEDGLKIAHCGDCGECSTAHDMAIMSTTADSLTNDSTRCAFKIFLGRRAVQKCMAERVGFTEPCEDCWLDNISCSFRACKFTCIKHKLFRQDNNKKDTDGELIGRVELNDCLKCDERMCGPQFIECSGSNRRRMGIVSDIGRDADNQCQAVDVDWFHLYDGDESMKKTEENEANEWV